MNRQTTADPVTERAELACRATAALEAAAEAAARRLDRHAARFGLSDAKLEMLQVLACCSGSCTCLYDLGDRLQVTRPNVTKLVDGLERAGLVERVPHPVDRRMVQARLTSAGTDLVRSAGPGRTGRMADLWEGIPDERLELLCEVLGRLAAPADGY